MSRHRELDAQPLPAESLIHLLGQLAGMIQSLDDRQYCAERAKGISGSIGSHVRHCLDHVEAFVQGVESAHIEYDRRRRGTPVESDRRVAVNEIDRLERRLQDIGVVSLAAPLTLSSTLAAGEEPSIFQSSVGRELAFVVSHTVHHFAVLALLARELGLSVPPRFGYAPSTPTSARDAA